MDTTRENVERWIAEHAKPHITRDYRPADEARDMLRSLVTERDTLDLRNGACDSALTALTAERDTLKALCVDLVEAVGDAESMANFHYRREGCIPCKDSLKLYAATLKRARGLIK